MVVGLVMALGVPLQVAHAQVLPDAIAASPDAVAATPDAGPPASPDAGEPACVPTCSPGYGCSAGVCRSLCNPACQRGEYCNQQRLCAFITAPVPDRPAPLDPEAALAVRQTVERQRRGAVRLQQRTVPRLTLDLGFGSARLEDRYTHGPSILNLILRAGLRKNFVRWLGAHLEGVVNLGHLTGAGVQFRGSSAVFGAGASGGVFFNAGRVYMGPFGAFERRSYGTNDVQINGYPYDLRETGPWHGSFGTEFGGLLLGRDQVDLRIRSGVVMPEETFMVQLSFGYHFLLDRGGQR